MNFSPVSDPFLLIGIRVIGTLSFLLLFWRLTEKRIPKFRIRHYFLLAVLASFLSSVLFVVSVKNVGVTYPILLFYTWTIWLNIWDKVSGVKVKKVDVETSIAVFIGNCALLFEPELNENWIGYVLAIFAGGAFSLFLFFSGVEKNRTPNDNWIAQDSFTFALMAIALLSFSYTKYFSIALPSIKATSFLFLDGALYGLGYLLLFKALKSAFNKRVVSKPDGSPELVEVSTESASHKVATYMGAFEPSMGIVFAYLILKQEIGIQVFIGFLIIVIAIVRRGRIVLKNDNIANT